jgi:phosphate/sulfate permease
LPADRAASAPIHGTLLDPRRAGVDLQRRFVCARIERRPEGDGAEAIRFLDKSSAVPFDADTQADLKAFKKQIDAATKFIPLWVKVAVAIALGMGTMVGWKRIVVAVGEKTGKSHLTYAQGASAELIAMTTIGAADISGCRCRPRTCCRPGLPARWQPTSPACNGARSAIC